MSEISRAKQRLMKSNTIMQAGQQDNQFKIFTRNNNSSSIPKLHQKYRERATSQIQIQDNYTEYLHDNNNLSPDFTKTERYNQYRNQFDDIKSERPDNMFVKKQKSRRLNTEYLQIPDLTFTENQRSVYNQSPEKVVKDTVHTEKLNIVIAKLPERRAISPFKPRECLASYVEERTQKQKSINQLFIDQMFPPRFTIIFNKKHMYLQQGLKLQRLTNIYKGNQVRLIKYCEPTLLIEGKFTSPALYSALVILSEEPTRVFNILGNQQYNETGIYNVQLCKDGVWRYIIIDDYFPVKILAKRSLLFMHTLQRNGIYQFWPCIIEKALAKIYGTYQDIYLTAKNGIKEIFRNLTGYPVSEYIINKDFRTYLVVIDTAIKKKQIVVVEFIHEQFKNTAHLKQIESEYSYQIIQVKKTYIVLRNLADKDLVTKLTFEQAMIFSRLLIFRCESNFVYISRTLRHKRNSYSIVRINLKSTIRCYWDAWQNSEIYYKNHIGSHIEYSKSNFIIKIRQQLSKKEENEERVYDSTMSDEIIAQPGKEIAIGPGQYYVIAHLCQKREQDFTLSYYGEDIPIEIERVKNMDRWEQQCQC